MACSRAHAHWGKPGARIGRLDLSAEICSEVAGFDNRWASDITVWINDVEIGTWTSPGDFGGERGRLMLALAFAQGSFGRSS